MAYRSPELTSYGTLSDLTRSGGSATRDASRASPAAFEG